MRGRVTQASTLDDISLYLLPAGRFSTKSKFHACRREISAYPPKEMLIKLPSIKFSKSETPLDKLTVGYR